LGVHKLVGVKEGSRDPLSSPFAFTGEEAWDYAIGDEVG
jgi:hypothetical protein